MSTGKTSMCALMTIMTIPKYGLHNPTLDQFPKSPWYQPCPLCSPDSIMACNEQPIKWWDVSCNVSGRSGWFQHPQHVSHWIYERCGLSHPNNPHITYFTMAFGRNSLNLLPSKWWQFSHTPWEPERPMAAWNSFHANVLGRPDQG